ncbi:MAG: DUF362 domain-containing protein [bacterium]|nr:DUF362 domain-containing protein [bacterium]
MSDLASPPTALERAQADVALVATGPSHQQVLDSVREAMELANWQHYISRGAAVSLKPNLGWDKLIPGAISAPWVVDAVIKTIRDHVGEIHVVEADQVVLSAKRALCVSGIDAVCERNGVQYHNMSKEPTVRVEGVNRRVLQDVRIPEILTRTELITLPLIKTHNKTDITGALKNQWGCLETLRHHFHLVLSDALADVNSLIQPRFAVMDGTVGLEGDGPKSGIPKEMNLVLAYANLVGIDAIAASLMGFDPSTVDHLKTCAEDGLGSIDGFQIHGESLQDHATAFIPSEHNAVSWLELALRRSTLQRLAFHSPLFPLLCWGARRYYDLWDLFVGRRRRTKFLAKSPYANQWKK